MTAEPVWLGLLRNKGRVQPGLKHLYFWHVGFVSCCACPLPVGMVQELPQSTQATWSMHILTWRKGFPADRDGDRHP